MTDIDAALQDERLARVMLTIASEPCDTVTRRLVRASGASETVHLAVETEASSDAPFLDVDAWRKRVGPRLSIGQCKACS